MNIRFVNDDFREYSQGPFHFTNEGKPFEVRDSVLADELLHARARIAIGGEMVNIFEPAVGASASDKATESLAAGYPEGFPSADALAAAGLSFEEVKLLNRDQLVALKGIGGKTADAILEHTKEN